MALHSIKQFHGFTVETVGGSLGTIKETLFDDDDWALRYFVVVTGKWFDNSEILVPPASVVRDEWDKQTVYVSLTQEQVRDAPKIDVTRPVLRAQEAEFLDHFGYSHYWTGPTVADKEALQPDGETPAEVDAQSRLHSSREVLGTGVFVEEDAAGQVDDLRFDDEGWSIRWIVVDPSNWSGGRNLLVAPARVERADWEEGRLVLGMTRDELAKCPRY